MLYKIGIEYEYMLLNKQHHLLYFENTDYPLLKNLLCVKNPPEDTFSSKHGGQKGYWYLEGDERFNHNGEFSDLKVKGIEIRTPPLNSVAESISFLLNKEQELCELLTRHHLSLAIAGHHPLIGHYQFNPPLNQWEINMRQHRKEYHLAEISTVCYGPDINLSFPDKAIGDIIDNVEKLNYYAPYIIPFSFSSPFHLSKKWPGLSWRSWSRRNLRPTCKGYIQNNTLTHPAIFPAINNTQQGRIEFKAFDAIPMIDLLHACCYLLVGICLDKTLPGRTAVPDGELYQTSAIKGFTDITLYTLCKNLVHKASLALHDHGLTHASGYMAILMEMLAEKKHPSDILLANYQKTGNMFFPGGLLHNKKWRLAHA